MKKVKKRYKILMGVLIVFLLIPPFQFFVLKDSVMEEIYRSVKRSYYNINNFEGIDKLDYEDIEGMFWMSNDAFLFTSFEDIYIDTRYKITLFFPSKELMDEKDIKIQGLYNLSDNVLISINMNYNHANRTITYNPIFFRIYKNDSFVSTNYCDEATITQYLTEYGITKEDIKDYQHYILYDVVYQSWVSGTDNGRKLNKWDYYNIKEVDNTFNFEVTE